MGRFSLLGRRPNSGIQGGGGAPPDDGPSERPRGVENGRQYPPCRVKYWFLARGMATGNRGPRPSEVGAKVTQLKHLELRTRRSVY
jgi:hypothetical protein